MYCTIQKAQILYMEKGRMIETAQENPSIFYPLTLIDELQYDKNITTQNEQ